MLTRQNGEALEPWSRPTDADRLHGKAVSVTTTTTTTTTTKVLIILTLH